MLLSSDDPVLISARIDVTDERRVLVANSIESVIAKRNTEANEALVLMKSSQVSDSKLAELKSLLLEHKGRIPVRLVIRQAQHSETVVKLPNNYMIEPSEKLSNGIEEIFGEPVMIFR